MFKSLFHMTIPGEIFSILDIDGQSGVSVELIDEGLVSYQGSHLKTVLLFHTHKKGHRVEYIGAQKLQ